MNCAGNTAMLVKGGIPIGLRILLGFSTVFGVRAYGWKAKDEKKEIFLTMDENADANYKMLGGKGGVK